MDIVLAILILLALPVIIHDLTHPIYTIVIDVDAPEDSDGPTPV